MVLLDSEGIDTYSEDNDDNQIFTLAVLLASVLIYNSQGVSIRRDLQSMEYPYYMNKPYINNTWKTKRIHNWRKVLAELVPRMRRFYCDFSYFSRAQKIGFLTKSKEF